MVIDTLMERGMSLADGIWGNVDTCRFPLFSFLQPLPLEWMCLVYMAMLVGRCIKHNCYLTSVSALFQKV